MVAITANAGSTGTRGWAPAAAAKSRRVAGFMRNLSAYQSGTEVAEAPILPHPARFADGASNRSNRANTTGRTTFRCSPVGDFRVLSTFGKGAKILGVASPGRPIALLPRQVRGRRRSERYQHYSVTHYSVTANLAVVVKALVIKDLTMVSRAGLELMPLVLTLLFPVSY